ncbi:MAG: hypothetical protein MUC69_00390 [Gemmatimonadales bacterium]|nr:hypothetical protein [Gemmatimonadales bacterium]
MRPLVALAALALTGCAYYRGYNGIYAADHLADEARKATAEGRPGEAANLWSRAAVKAESLLVRQPSGKWSGDALAIRGEALAHLGQCVDAVPMLQEAQARAGDDRELGERVALAQGRCELALGRPDAAVETLGPLAGSRDLQRRQQAELLRARALLSAGRYEEALAALEAGGAAATSLEVLAARAGMGQREEVLAAADLLLASRDSMLPWDSLLAVVGRGNPAIGSAVLDRLVAAGGVAEGNVPYLLSADADRLSGDARSQRLAEVVRRAPASDVGELARLELARLQLATSSDIAALGPLADTLEALAGVGLPSAQRAAAMARGAAAIRSVSDSVGPGAPQGDLRLFLAAEYARDSLGAPRIAMALFQRVVREWPDGAYTPKALLAGRQLDGAWTDATDSLLFGRYAESPYVVAARGGSREEFLRLEDSLAAYARLLAPAVTTAPRRPATRPTVQRRTATDSSGAPSRAPNPVRRGQREPEP